MTGVLPIALEAATKIIQAISVGGKEYICVMKLHSKVSETKLKKVLTNFRGMIYQRPPLRSAVKRRLRKRMIYYLDFLEMDGRNVLLKIGCQAGTYIRKLAHDIGEALGIGAHMQELIRTRAGSFTTDKLINLHDLVYIMDDWRQTENESNIRKYIMPMEKALSPIPKIKIRDSAVDAICHGALLTAPGVTSFETGIRRKDKVAIFTIKGEAVAFAEATVSSSDMLKMDHGIIARPLNVLMPRGTYPKMWKTRK